jgi:hypothetical protein
MKKVYKEHLFREVPNSKLQEYLAAGWHLEPRAADVINLKPVTKTPAVTEKEPGNAIDIKGD